MKRLIIFALFCILAGTAFGQYPANPNKIRLGNQTSGDGLVYRGSGAPAYTPSDYKNAWVYIDSVAGRMYTYRGGAWEFVSAGAGVDSLAYRNDSLFVYSPDTTFFVVIDRTITVAGSSGTPQTVDPGQTVTISNGFGITTTAGATRTVEVKADTAAMATKTWVSGLGYIDLATVQSEISDSSYFYNTLSDFTAIAASTNFPINRRIRIGNTGAEYLVGSSAVSGYTTDTVAVIPVSGGKYAVLQQRDDGYLVDDFGATPNDTTDNDFFPIKKAIEFGKKIIFATDGIYKVNPEAGTADGWDMKQNQVIDQRNSIIISDGSDVLQNLYVAEYADSNIVIRNARFSGGLNYNFDGTDTMLQSSNYRFFLAQDTARNIRLENIELYGCGYAVKFRWAENVVIENLRTYQCAMPLQLFQCKYVDINGFTSDRTLMETVNDQDHHTYINHTSYLKINNASFKKGNGKTIYIKADAGYPDLSENITISNVFSEDCEEIWLAQTRNISLSNINVIDSKNHTIFGGDSGIRDLTVSGLNIYNKTDTAAIKVFNHNAIWYGVSVSNINTIGRVIFYIKGFESISINGGVIKNPTKTESEVIVVGDNNVLKSALLSNLVFQIDSLDANISRLIRARNSSDGFAYAAKINNCVLVETDVSNSVVSFISPEGLTSGSVELLNCTSNSTDIQTEKSSNLQLTNCKTESGDLASIVSSSISYSGGKDYEIFFYTGAGGDSLTVDSFKIRRVGERFKIVTSSSLKVKPSTGTINGQSSITIQSPREFVSNGTNLYTVDNDIFNKSGTAYTSSIWDLNNTVQTWRNGASDFAKWDATQRRVAIRGDIEPGAQAVFSVRGHLIVTDSANSATSSGRIYFGRGSVYGPSGTNPLYMRHAAGKWYFTGTGIEEMSIDLNPSSVSTLAFSQGTLAINANQGSSYGINLQTQGVTRFSVFPTYVNSVNTFSVGTDNSFVHDPAADTTYLKGNLTVEGTTKLRENLSTESTTDSTQAVLFQITLMNTTSGALAVKAPATPIAGDWFAVSDSRGQAGANNITVAFTSASQNLHGSSQDHVISTNKGFVKFIYVNSTVGWIIAN